MQMEEEASGGETEETIDKIMSLVNKMVDEDESGDVSGMPEPPTFDTWIWKEEITQEKS